MINGCFHYDSTCSTCLATSRDSAIIYADVHVSCVKCRVVCRHI